MENTNNSKVDQKNNNNNNDSIIVNNSSELTREDEGEKKKEGSETIEAIVFIADDHIKTPSPSLPENHNNPLLSLDDTDLISETIDGRKLHCIDVTDDNILVALKDRDMEIHELVKLHQDYFDSVRSFIDSEEEWKRFREILYSKRDDINDVDWINLIEEFFGNDLPLFVKFKEIVGYDEYSEEDDDDSIKEDKEDIFIQELAD